MFWRDRERQRETERDRERHRETERDRERQRETERDRERQRLRQGQNIDYHCHIMKIKKFGQPLVEAIGLGPIRSLKNNSPYLMLYKKRF